MRSETLSLQRRPILSIAILAVSIGAAVGGAPAARAQTPSAQFYFSSSDTSYVPVTSESFAAGSTFTLSVFYTTSGFAATGNSFNVMDVFVGFDQTNSYGTSATTLDNRLTLADSDNPNSAAVTATTASSGFSELIPGSSNELEGGQPTGEDGVVIRPFGVDIPLTLATGATSLTDVSTPTELLNLTFDNTDLAAGPETISIYNGGTGTDGTTYLNGTTYVQPNTTLFTAMQIGGSSGATPEPSALALLLAGASPVVGIVLRRRRSMSRYS